MCGKNVSFILSESGLRAAETAQHGPPKWASLSVVLEPGRGVHSGLQTDVGSTQDSRLPRVTWREADSSNSKATPPQLHACMVRFSLDSPKGMFTGVVRGLRPSASPPQL